MVNGVHDPVESLTGSSPKNSTLVKHASRFPRQISQRGQKLRPLVRRSI